jgi:hypothetical protein
MVKSGEKSPWAEQESLRGGQANVMSKNTLETIEHALDQLTAPEKLKLIEQLARSLRVPRRPARLTRGAKP